MAKTKSVEQVSRPRGRPKGSFKVGKFSKGKLIAASRISIANDVMKVNIEEKGEVKRVAIIFDDDATKNILLLNRNTRIANKLARFYDAAKFNDYKIVDMQLVASSNDESIDISITLSGNQSSFLLKATLNKERTFYLSFDETSALNSDFLVSFKETARAVCDKICDVYDILFFVKSYFAVIQSK